MKHKILLIAALAMVPMLAPAKAEAGERCKTYTKSIRIDGRLEIGYGKACERGGVWEIVKLSGVPQAKDRVVERIYTDLDDDYRVVIVDRSYSYSYPRTYYTRRVVYSPPRYYAHAYKHNYGHYKKAQKHHAKPSHKQRGGHR